MMAREHSERVEDPQRRKRIGPSIARLTFGLIAINVIWRCVRYGLGFPIWGDEAFVVMNLVQRDFAGLLAPLEYGQIAPLLFMWVELAATRLFGFSEWALRLAPFLAGVVSMVLFWRFAVKTLNRWAALLAVGIFAASYYPIRHATEVKPYSVDLLVSLVLLHLAWAVMLQPRRLGAWLALIVAASASLWMSYPAAFVAGGVGILLVALLARERSARVAILLTVYGLSLGSSFLIMFLVYAGPHAAASWVPGTPGTLETWGGGFPFVKGIAYFPLWLLKAHTGNMLAYPIGGRDGGSTLTFVLVLVGIGVLWRRRRDLLLLMLCPLPLTFIAAAMQRYPYGYSARLALHVAPTVCLLTGVGLAAFLKAWLPPRKVSAGFGVAAIVLFCIAVGGVVRDVVKPSKTFADQENRRVIRWLAENTRAGDQWVSFNAANHEIVHGDNLYRRGGSGARHRFYLHRFAPVPILWAPDPTTIQTPTNGRTWLIVFRDDRVPFPEDRLLVYVHSLTEKQGQPRRHVFPLRHSKYDMAIEIYEFAKSR